MMGGQKYKKGRREDGVGIPSSMTSLGEGSVAGGGDWGRRSRRRPTARRRGLDCWCHPRGDRINASGPGGNDRCAGTAGDGRFHLIMGTSDLGSGDDDWMSIGLFGRPR